MVTAEIIPSKYERNGKWRTALVISFQACGESGLHILASDRFAKTHGLQGSKQWKCFRAFAHMYHLPSVRSNSYGWGRERIFLHILHLSYPCPTGKHCDMTVSLSSEDI